MSSAHRGTWRYQSHRPVDRGGQVPNFARSRDPARPARVYSDDTRHRLAALADRHDPAGVLATAQVIRV